MTVPRPPAGAVVVSGTGRAEPTLPDGVRRVRGGRRLRLPLGGSPEGAAAGWFVLEAPGHAGFGRRSLVRLVRHARAHPVGLVNVLLPGATDGSAPVRLWRAAALQAAREQRGPEEPLAVAAGRLTGVRWEAGQPFGIVDLRHPAGHREPLPGRAARWLRHRLPARVDGWLAGRARELRRRARNYLFLD